MVPTTAIRCQFSRNTTVPFLSKTDPKLATERSDSWSSWSQVVIESVGVLLTLASLYIAYRQLRLLKRHRCPLSAVRECPSSGLGSGAARALSSRACRDLLEPRANAQAQAQDPQRARNAGFDSQNTLDVHSSRPTTPVASPKSDEDIQHPPQDIRPFHDPELLAPGTSDVHFPQDGNPDTPNPDGHKQIPTQGFGNPPHPDRMHSPPQPKRTSRPEPDVQTEHESPQDHSSRQKASVSPPT